MKRASTLLIVGLLLTVSGCTRIVKMEPTSGPPGTAVYIKYCGMFGDPAAQKLIWDGEVIRHPFPGSFVVPMPEDGGTPGKHTVTLVDDVDATEAFLIFPLLRIRHAQAKFIVTEL
ncbi:MAG: hypothetical protein JW709_04045 [Sedimentisphaerales bacterium]|nr:hypothetical protein [Sedimentisphaerales bacterium]